MGNTKKSERHLPGLAEAFSRGILLAMNRNRILLVVLIVGAAILLFIPFGRRGRSSANLPGVKADTVAPLVSYVQKHYETPEKYIVGSFANHEIVFLGEYGKIRQNVDLVQQLIPSLYAAGIHQMGIEYALSSDQGSIDKLLTAPSFDAALAKKILFDYLVIWGYQGYENIFKAAWSFNHSLPAGSPPFRIIGLSVAQDWQYIKTKKDAEDPAVLHKVFANGIPDVHMAQVIDKQFIAKGEKALIYLDVRSAFTRYRSSGYAENMKKMGFTQTERAGNLIYDKIGNKSFTILFHQPWPSSGARVGAVYPVNGAIDHMIAKLPENERTAGFDVRGTVFGKLPLGASDFAKGQKGITLGQLCDGYIIQGPLSGYKPVRPIHDFITTSNVAAAVRLFPGPKVQDLKPENLNRFIAGNLDNLGRYLERFR